MIAWFRTLHVAAEKRCFPPNSLPPLLDCQVAETSKVSTDRGTELKSEDELGGEDSRVNDGPFATLFRTSYRS
jgi:hypothetical protein